jgi:hypothetical protein
MAESPLHDLLEQAIGELPPSSVNIGLACSQGQRKRRWRRVYLPATAPVAAAAAVTLIVTGAPFGLGGGHAGDATMEHPNGPRSHPAYVAHPPANFSLSAPYALFGWLPPGFSASGFNVLGDPDGQSAVNENIWASRQHGDGKALSLEVYAAGSCKLAFMPAPATAGSRQRNSSIRQRDSSRRRGLGLDCGDGGSWGLFVSRAPDVNGGRAYWDQHGNLNWLYGRDAWAQLVPSTQLIEPHLDPHFDGWYSVPARPRSQFAPGHAAYKQSAATQALLLKVAAAIRYGGTTPQLYGFTLGGMPASWRADASPYSFAFAGSQIVNTEWSIGPASDPQGLSISVEPATADTSCKMFAGESQYVTVDGVQAALRTIDMTGKHEQDLCVPNIDGLAVTIDVDLEVPGANHTPLPGSAELGSALAVFRHLRLLGTSRAHWTPDPLG